MLDDLFAEMQAGKRASVGNPQAQWAKDFDILPALPACAACVAAGRKDGDSRHCC
ncbi:hypothetical protein [Thiorhodospira sibirica]|uniref:hypothetical protein n=1 Tax=Thiorhodospira sibirica TaxID=154347 RepID=UPI00131F39A7|nr:hypothetical protein [Thiorhodospira sibirica]